MSLLNRPRSHSLTSLFVHIVWTTLGREAWIEPRLDPWLAAFLARKALVLECALVAAGNAADHVHLVVRHPAALSVADLVHRLKGASSRAITLEHGIRQGWQTGYWAESVGPRDVRALAQYVVAQRAHHQRGTSYDPWEPSVPA